MRAMHSVLYVVPPRRDVFPSLEGSQSPMGFSSLQSTFLWGTALLNGSSTPYFNSCKAKIRSTAQRFLTSLGNFHMELNY